MAGFNFKRAGLNTKKRNNRQNYNKNYNKNNNKQNNNKSINSSINIITNKNNNSTYELNAKLINTNIQETEKELMKEFWPTFSYEKKTLANILKHNEKIYQNNINWYKFVYNK